MIFLSFVLIQKKETKKKSRTKNRLRLFVRLARRLLLFTYDAAGTKLIRAKNTIYPGNYSVINNDRYYVGGVEYLNASGTVVNPAGALVDIIQNAEGFAKRETSGSYSDNWILRDHLGNTRVVFKDANNDGVVNETDIVQVNAYYPFGLNHGANINGAGGSFKYQYNGKELNDDFGLNWNDYGARFYDPAIGRWHATDPMAEMYVDQSPYHYVMNNPVKNIDPDGMHFEIGDLGCHCSSSGDGSGGSGGTETGGGSAFQVAVEKTMGGGGFGGGHAQTNGQPGPTAREAVLMSQNSYGVYWDGVLEGSWSVSTRTFGLEFDQPVNGLKSKLYERTINNITEFVYATVGTADWKDWKENGNQTFGQSGDYKASIDNARILSKELKNFSLTFVGHSQGGGEAAANSMATGRMAITFNAAGVSSSTLSNNRIDIKKNSPETFTKITAFIMDTDPLNNLQNNPFSDLGRFLPDVDGRTVMVKATSFSSKINGHSIDNLVKEILKTYPK